MLFYLIHIYAYIYICGRLFQPILISLAVIRESLWQRRRRPFSAIRWQLGALISCILIGVSINGVPEIECLEGKIYLPMDDLVVPCGTPSPILGNPQMFLAAKSKGRFQTRKQFQTSSSWEKPDFTMSAGVSCGQAATANQLSGKFDWKPGKTCW